MYALLGLVIVGNVLAASPAVTCCVPLIIPVLREVECSYKIVSAHHDAFSNVVGSDQEGLG